MPAWKYSGLLLLTRSQGEAPLNQFYNIYIQYLNNTSPHILSVKNQHSSINSYKLVKFIQQIYQPPISKRPHIQSYPKHQRYNNNDEVNYTALRLWRSNLFILLTSKLARRDNLSCWCFNRNISISVF